MCAGDVGPVVMGEICRGLMTDCDVEASGFIGWEMEGKGNVRFITVELK